MGTRYNPGPYPDLTSSAGWPVTIPSVNRARPAPPKPAGATISQQVLARRERLRQGMFWAMFTVVPAGIFFSTGTGTAFTLLTVYAGLSDWWFGVAAAMPFLAALTHIPASVYLQRHIEARKPLTIWAGTFHRLLFAPLAAIPFFLGPIPTTAALFLGLWALCQVLGQTCAFSWQNWMADLVPPRKRGKFFGRRSMLFHLTMLVSGIVLAWFLPQNMQAPGAGLILFILFIIAALTGAMDILGYVFVRDDPPLNPAKTSWQTNLLKPLRDPTFRPLLYFAMTATAGTFFLWPFLFKQMLNALHVDAFKTMIALQVAPIGAVMCMSTVWGRCLDRIGRKPTLLVGCVGGALVTLVWFVISPELWWLGLIVTALGQTLWNAVDQGYFNYVLLFTSGGKNGTSSGDNTGYAAVFNVGISLAGMAASLLSGALANHLDNSSWVVQVQQTIGPLQFSPYLLLVLISVALRLSAAAIFLPRIQEPGAPTALKSVKMVGKVIFESLSDIPSPWSDREAKVRVAATKR